MVKVPDDNGWEIVLVKTINERGKSEERDLPDLQRHKLILMSRIRMS